MKIGSHVSMSGKEMLLGSVKEAISYGANTFMFYTGAPQNTVRKPIDQLHIEEAHALMKEHDINADDVVVHAPYIINLGNTVKPDTYELAVSFLQKEIDRCEAMGMHRLVLHPGAHVGAGREAGLKSIVKGLNTVLQTPGPVRIALETMAGKGTELGRDIEDIQYIISHCDYPERLGVCLDTCHIHDSGVPLETFDDYLADFDRAIGIDKILVMHINDSKNVCGAHKDRHENIGFGHIGFTALNHVVHHPKLKDIPKILETPYVNKRAPYKEEIKMLKAKTFNENLIKILEEN